MAPTTSRDRWLTWAIRIVGLLVIGALAYLGVSMYQGLVQARESSVSDRAISNLQQAVRDNPENPNVYILLGDAYRETGDPSGAIEQYEKALELEADHPVALSGLALVAMQQEEWRTAEGYWQKAIEVLRTNKFAAQDLRLEKAYYHYGATLIQVNELEDAVANLKEALRIRRDDADTHYALSVAYRELGSVNKQKESLEAALLFVPTMPEANYDRALLYLAEGDEASAAELLRRSVDAAPGRDEPLEELLKLGSFEDRMAAARSLEDTDASAALIEARIAAALDPEDVDATRFVARLLGRLDSPEDERAAWERVLNLRPDDPEAIEALAALDAGS